MLAINIQLPNVQNGKVVIFIDQAQQSNPKYVFCQYGGRALCRLLLKTPAFFANLNFSINKEHAQKETFHFSGNV